MLHKLNKTDNNGLKYKILEN